MFCSSRCSRFQLENETSFTTKKGRSVENSIARAYIAAIRKARNFIYIENQYFMGSAYGWLDDQDVHCYNVIPMEITQKICDSIHANRRYGERTLAGLIAKLDGINFNLILRWKCSKADRSQVQRDKKK